MTRSTVSPLLETDTICQRVMTNCDKVTGNRRNCRYGQWRSNLQMFENMRRTLRSGGNFGNYQDWRGKCQHMGTGSLRPRFEFSSRQTLYKKEDKRMRKQKGF